MKTFKSFAVLTTAIIALLSWSCEYFQSDEKRPKLPTITISEPVFDAETMTLKATITPSAEATAFYYKLESEGVTTSFEKVEGNEAYELVATIEFDINYSISAYAENADGESELVIMDYCALSIPTITVSEPAFDEATMTISFEVVPSKNTFMWYWSVNDEAATEYKDNEARTISYEVAYDTDYTFVFGVKNEQGNGQKKEVVFSVMSQGAEIAIENLTAFTVDAKVTKKEHCVKYVVGAVHSEAYNRDTFIEQAQRSLNPDSSYPLVIFNSATESATFSEQNLVRNTLIDSTENEGLLLTPGVSYTVAVYGENEAGQYNVTTKEFTVPTAELNGDHTIAIEVSDITETSAKATVTADEGCKVIMGYIDTALTKADTENSFDFEGKSAEEIKNYIISVANIMPELYTEPITRTLSNYFAIGGEYVAYAIAIKDGKVGDVAYEIFSTLKPALTGIAKITSAEIIEQTSHETLSVFFTTDHNATKIRLYAAPSNDFNADKDNLTYILDAEEYQNYREEYAVDQGESIAKIDIYHPGDRYYLYASAVDKNGKAGEMVCVAQMAGLDTEYYTTIEEIVIEPSISLDGTGTVDMVVTVDSQKEDRIYVTVNTDTRSENASKVWLIRYNGKIDEIESKVRYAFSEYGETNKILGSYKEAKVGYPLKYEDGGSSFDPKYEALQEYDPSWGGDILVAVVLDTDGKLNIYSYYAAGGSVVVL